MAFAAPTAVSLFSSGGIGDLAVRAAGFDILVSNEQLADRHAVFKYNFPTTHALTGDIWLNLDRLEEAARNRLNGAALSLLFATPPCQGMSKNGRGKLLAAVRAGRKPPLDPRNRLILPAIEMARRLQPETVLLENVPEMANTVILDNQGEPIKILDHIRLTLGPAYEGQATTVEFADYGVPQRRQRLITVFSRNSSLIEWLEREGSFMPAPTHSADHTFGTQPWRTVRESIGHLPPLDASNARTARSGLAFHRVPVLDPMKYWWVENTPAERSAFDNQCVQCGYQENLTHSAKRDHTGINRASKCTPLYCGRCGEMLPRPSVQRNGSRQIMRGYTSAYKRMAYDRPASALTRNLSYACSDNKLHPEQNRVLSLLEAFVLHSIDQYEYRWKRADGRTLSDKTIREIVGESVPPAGLQAILDHLVAIKRGEASPPSPPAGRLF